MPRAMSAELSPQIKSWIREAGYRDIVDLARDCGLQADTVRATFYRGNSIHRGIKRCRQLATGLQISESEAFEILSTEDVRWRARRILARASELNIKSISELSRRTKVPRGSMEDILNGAVKHPVSRVYKVVADRLSVPFEILAAELSPPA